ncbi:thioredoxin family protein [Rugamonas sp.]|uniref:thioredoxin family protein n=1 Tax=Rugamonas sp. TaxID=1926287 RepID=UPI0025D60D4B|nr:thioredoxin family protein [Rugamonas sp.]
MSEMAGMATATVASNRIAWRDGAAGPAAGDGMAAAFAQAAAGGQALFLYWGAAWCPPCNRVKADIFARDDFAARMRHLLPVRLDGDSPGAQALAARYRLRSYPTLLLFRPDGSEITRLPCELDGELFIAALDVALQANYTAAQSLQAALTSERALATDEWALLSHYSWDTDEGRLLGGRDPAATLTALAAACPADADAGRFAARLSLHAMVAINAMHASSAPAVDAGPDADALLAILVDAPLARANMDLLGNSGIALIKATAGRRAELVAALSAAAKAWSGDPRLGASDRLSALRLQMRLARLVGPAAAAAAPPEQISRQIAAMSSAMLAVSVDPHARHALVNTAVGALHDAGLPQLAEALLLAELPRSHSPYYFMLSLAASAKRRGDTAAMLDWYQQAAAGATGPATRIQWSVTYLASLIDHAPQDSDRIEQAAQALLRDIDASADADTFQQRNGSQLQRAAAKLAGLPQAGAHARAVATAIAAGLAE